MLITELYPIHVAPVTAPQGMAHVIEPKVIRQQDYTYIQPARAPYEPVSYSKRLWIC